MRTVEVAIGEEKVPANVYDSPMGSMYQGGISRIMRSNRQSM